jgi:tetratricopeptide (TPR) repeat protein
MKSIVSLLVLIILAVKSNGQDSMATLSRANEYYQQSRFDMAEMLYRKALDKDPGNGIAQYNLANALQKQKKYDEAIKILQKLASTTKDNNLKSPTYYNQGVAYTKLKDLESSIEAYKNALRLNPNDQQARENLQKALREQKQKQQQQQNQQKQKQESKMSQKEAEQKLKLLQQKEKDLQQRLQNRNKQQGSSQAQDW